MSMCNDIVWDAKGHDELCEIIQRQLKKYAERFPRGHWSFQGPGSGKKWYGTYDHKPDGSWDRTAAQKPIIRYSVVPVPWRRIKKQSKWKEVNTQQWQHPKRCVASPNGHRRQSAR